MGARQPIARGRPGRGSAAQEGDTAGEAEAHGADLLFARFWRRPFEVAGLKPVWSCPALMDGLGLGRACLGHHVSFRIRWAKDSPGPSGGVRDCRNFR